MTQFAETLDPILKAAGKVLGDDSRARRFVDAFGRYWAEYGELVRKQSQQEERLKGVEEHLKQVWKKPLSATYGEIEGCPSPCARTRALQLLGSATFFAHARVDSAKKKSGSAKRYL